MSKIVKGAGWAVQNHQRQELFGMALAARCVGSSDRVRVGRAMTLKYTLQGFTSAMLIDPGWFRDGTSVPDGPVASC